MNTERIRCTNCGAEFEEYDPQATVFVCKRCKATFIIKQAQKFAKIQIDHDQDILKLRGLLSEAVKNQNATMIWMRANAIRELIPNDFYASFCEVLSKSLQGDPRLLEEFLCKAHDEIMTAETRDEAFAIILANFDYHNRKALETFINLHYPKNEQSRRHTQLQQLIDRLKDDVNRYEASVPRDVFICHSGSDKDIAMDVYHCLEADGCKCWITYENLRKETIYYWKDITDAIHAAKLFLTISSQDCMLRNDPQEEVRIAKAAGKGRIEYKTDLYRHTTLFADFFDGLQWVDGTEHGPESLSKLCKRVYFELEEQRSGEMDTPTGEDQSKRQEAFPGIGENASDETQKETDTNGKDEILSADQQTTQGEMDDNQDEEHVPTEPLESTGLYVKLPQQPEHAVSPTVEKTHKNSKPELGPESPHPNQVETPIKKSDNQASTNNEKSIDESHTEKSSTKKDVPPSKIKPATLNWPTNDDQDDENLHDGDKHFVFGVTEGEFETVHNDSDIMLKGTWTILLFISSIVAALLGISVSRFFVIVAIILLFFTIWSMRNNRKNGTSGNDVKMEGTQYRDHTKKHNQAIFKTVQTDDRVYRKDRTKAAIGSIILDIALIFILAYNFLDYGIYNYGHIVKYEFGVIIQSIILGLVSIDMILAVIYLASMNPSASRAYKVDSFRNKARIILDVLVLFALLNGFCVTYDHWITQDNWVYLPIVEMASLLVVSLRLVLDVVRLFSNRNKMKSISDTVPFYLTTAQIEASQKKDHGVDKEKHTELQRKKTRRVIQ